MAKLDWVKDLVRAEEKMEESGVVDLSFGFDHPLTVQQETLELLNKLKNDFIEASAVFNELKQSPIGRIKIYGIAKTQADFMLFRNGFKMIFSMLTPGEISIRFNFLGPSQLATPMAATSNSATVSQSAIPSINSTHSLMEEHKLIAKKGPFEELVWTFQDQEVRLPSLVRFYLSLFLKESAK